jgi:hypothetical protein
VENVALMGEMRNAYKTLVGKPVERRSFRRPSCIWIGNIRMDLRKTWWDGVDWIYLSRNKGQMRALVYMVMNLGFP